MAAELAHQAYFGRARGRGISNSIYAAIVSLYPESCSRRRHDLLLYYAACDPTATKLLPA